MKNALVRACIVASILSTAVLTTAPSQAQEEEAPATRPASWYGWQTLTADAATLGLTAATGNAFVFIGGYTLGAPIVHFAHGNVLRGIASLALRVVVPLATTAIVYSLETQGGVTNGHEGGTAASIGLLGGGLFASAFDAGILAWSPGAPF